MTNGRVDTPTTSPLPIEPLITKSNTAPMDDAKKDRRQRRAARSNRRSEQTASTDAHIDDVVDVAASVDVADTARVEVDTAEPTPEAIIELPVAPIAEPTVDTPKVEDATEPIEDADVAAGTSSHTTNSRRVLRHTKLRVISVLPRRHRKTTSRRRLPRRSLTRRATPSHRRMEMGKHTTRNQQRSRRSRPEPVAAPRRSAIDLAAYTLSDGNGSLTQTTIEGRWRRLIADTGRAAVEPETNASKSPELSITAEPDDATASSVDNVGRVPHPTRESTPEESTSLRTQSPSRNRRRTGRRSKAAGIS